MYAVQCNSGNTAQHIVESDPDLDLFNIRMDILRQDIIETYKQHRNYE